MIIMKKKDIIRAHSRVYSMHDEELNGIEIKKDELRLVFDSLLHPYKHAKKCILVFHGFEDINYDVQFFSIAPDKDLNLTGKKSFLYECLNDKLKKGNPLMIVTDIFVSSNRVIVEGVPYEEKNFSHSTFAISIASKEFYYLWFR